MKHFQSKSPNTSLASQTVFRPKPKLAEKAIFLFGQNQYRNWKKLSVSAETEKSTISQVSTHKIESETETERWFTVLAKPKFGQNGRNSQYTSI